LRLPFRHIGVQANLTRGLAQTKRFSPWVLIDAGVVRGRKLTSWEHIQTDVKNAGGNWINEEVVVDNGLVTSRKPDDIPAFNKKMIEEFCEGKRARQTQFAGARAWSVKHALAEMAPSVTRRLKAVEFTRQLGGSHLVLKEARGLPARRR
jgi:hypothetical protein